MMTANEKRTQQQKIQQQKERERERDILIKLFLRKQTTFSTKKHNDKKKI